MHALRGCCRIGKALNAALAQCSRCDGKRQVWNQWAGKNIRCPLCTTAAVKIDAKGTKEFFEYQRDNLSGTEKRRIGRAIAQLLAVASLENFRIPGVPDELAPTDRILQRWAAYGSGMPAENPDAYRVSRPPPLDDDTQAEVSAIINATATGMRAFIREWYCSPEPIYLMAKRRHMNRRELAKERNAVLSVMRFKFLASPHTDLVAMARISL